MDGTSPLKEVSERTRGDQNRMSSSERRGDDSGVASDRYQHAEVEIGTGHGSLTRDYELLEWKDLDMKKYFFWGSVATFLIDVAVYPADLVKVRLQSQASATMLSSCPKYSGTASAFRQIARQEGFRGFYKGFGYNTLGNAPGQIAYFASYEYSKHRLRDLANRNGLNGGWVDPTIYFTAGFLAEATSAVVWVPFDMVSQRLMVQGGASSSSLKKQVYRNGLDCVRKTYRAEGVRGFYHGYGPAVLAHAPESAVSWVVYEYLRKLLYMENDDDERSDEATTTTWRNHANHMIAGGTAGLCGAVASYPIDVCKTRLQLLQRQSDPVSLSPASDPKYSSTWATLKTIFKEEGFPAFRQGLLARVIYSVPVAALGFSVYEVIKKLSQTSDSRRAFSSHLDKD